MCLHVFVNCFCFFALCIFYIFQDNARKTLNIFKMVAPGSLALHFIWRITFFKRDPKQLQYSGELRFQFAILIFGIDRTHASRQARNVAARP